MSRAAAKKSPPKFPADRTVWVVGEIRDECLEAFLTGLERAAGRGPARVVLASEGGQEWVGHAMHDAIRAAGNVTVDALGAAHSIAAAVLQAGAVRRVAPHATLMVHHGHWDDVEKKLPQDELLRMARRVEADNALYYRVLAGRSGASPETVRAWCERETWFTAEEAVAAGLADEILGGER